MHSDGFYLQVEGLDPAMFDQGPANLLLLVRFGETGSTIEARPYQNALVGASPEDDKAIFSTLACDSSGRPVEVWDATYSGGEVGWSITWRNAPDEAAAGGPDGQDAAAFLQALYQLVSYRVMEVNGSPVRRSCWSRPIAPRDESDEGASGTTWVFQKAFETASLIDASNRYAAVGDTFTVRLSMVDVFGNSLPSDLAVDLEVVYNDPILGLGDWVGTQVEYTIAEVDGVELRFELSLDASVVQSSEGEVDDEQREITRQVYDRILDQVSDPKIRATAQTGGVLAAGALSDLVGGGDTLRSGLAGYVQGIVEWLAAGGRGVPPDPVVLALALDRSYPSQWQGDLQELAVQIDFERTGVDNDIAKKSPEVRRVVSPVQPVEQTPRSAESSDAEEQQPSGLTTFAIDLEAAYRCFDGGKGVIKVATGIHSDLGSQRFGQRGIWLMRWGQGAGVVVDVKNNENRKAVFYAPPPLSRQLITRDVDGLRRYQNPENWQPVTRVFASTDVDQWAADFLAKVETLFGPELAPAVANRSTAQDQLYDPFVDHKEELAESIAATLDYVYVEENDAGDSASARETWRQALLRTLANDYGYSTLTQLRALVRLNGELEPGRGDNPPPQLYGAVQTRGSERRPEPPDAPELPYSLTPATLALVEGDNWLNFLVSARAPAAQRAFALKLDYQVSQLEHLRDAASMACGYTPSSWLTFVLQQNEVCDPEDPNTLTQQIGQTRIPIPLRSFPPLPKLLSVAARPQDDIDSISDALTWNLVIEVERSGADQDTLNLSLTFNEVVQESAAAATSSTLATGRPAPADLFDALGRFVFEYPQLEPYLDALAGGGEEAVQAVREFSDLVAGVATTWPTWQPPEPRRGGLDPASAASDVEVWHFEIQDVEGSSDLTLVTESSHPPQWPQIEGYDRVEENDRAAIYKPVDGERLRKLVMSWRSFYILDYQSVRPSAYHERNRNLAPEGGKTNPVFVYRTESVSWPTPIVPLVRVDDLIRLESQGSLETAVNAMLAELSTPPSGSIIRVTSHRRESGGSEPLVRFETSVDFRYEVLTSRDSSTFSLLPVFLLEEAFQQKRQRDEAAERIARNLSTWREATAAQSPGSSLRYVLTLFATEVVGESDRLPLVQFPGLVIPVPIDDRGWW